MDAKHTRKLGAWADELIAAQEDARGSVSQPALADALAAKILDDADLVRELAQPQARQYAYGVVQRRLAAGRRAVGGARTVALADDPAAGGAAPPPSGRERQIVWERILEPAAPGHQAFARFWEWNGDRHFRLPRMDEAALRASAAHNLLRAGAGIKKAGLELYLAARLGPGQTVQDRFSPAELAAIFARLRVDPRWWVVEDEVPALEAVYAVHDRPAAAD